MNSQFFPLKSNYKNVKKKKKKVQRKPFNAIIFLVLTCPIKKENDI